MARRNTSKKENFKEFSFDGKEIKYSGRIYPDSTQSSKKVDYTPMTLTLNGVITIKGCKLMQFLFILNHGLIAFVTPVAPLVVFHGCLAMADMVICGNNVAGFHEGSDHVEVASGMLTEAMDQLNDANRLAGRDIDPAVYFVTLVVRSKLDFM